MNMNAIILKNNKYHVDLQIQDDVLHFGPFDTEDQARTEWAKQSQSYNSWGKPEDVDLYEAMTVQKEILIKLPNKYKKKCSCGNSCKAD